MSAISAIYYRNQCSDDVRTHLESDLIKLNEGMVHHGKDGSGIWLGQQCGLAQQITHYHGQPWGETRPYYEAEQQVSIVAHGRLFNQSELKKQLQLPLTLDIHDHQLILKAYLKWNLECPNYLVGEFSILLWDEKCKQLLAIVDHFNSRSLYYYMDHYKIVFASELKALHCLHTIPRELNLNKIARNDWLKFQAEAGETSFSNIYFLPAAHRLVIGASKHLLYQYWQPTLNDPLAFSSNEELCETFQEQFAEAIRATTNSHLPVCLQLSGGLDSSSIAMMYAKLNAKESKPLICFSNVLPSSETKPNNDEKEYLDLIQSNQLVKEPIIDEWRGPFDSLDKFSENLCTSAQYYQHYAINDAARRYGAKIILHGTMGEITSSYSGHEYLAELFYQGRYLNLFKEIFQYKKHSNQSAYRIFFNHVLNPMRPQWLKKPTSLNSRAKLLAYSLIRPSFIAEVIPEDQLQAMTEQFLRVGQHSTKDARHNAYTQLNWFLQHASNVFNQFSDAPKSAVYLSNPYFDKRFVEFCLHIPNQYRFQNGYPRSIIRIGMQNVLPKKILTRLSKTPFLPDYSVRYYRQLSIAKNTIQALSSHPLVQQVIDVNKLQQLMEASSSSKSPDAHLNFLNFLVIPRAIYLAKFLSSF
jgi:asparagine synthase (glutamine-hydrolysing)